jgi:predicted ATPase
MHDQSKRLNILTAKEIQALYQENTIYRQNKIFGTNVPDLSPTVLFTIKRTFSRLSSHKKRMKAKRKK